jgi:hypothetical protein
MVMTAKRIDAMATEAGLMINGHLYNTKLPLKFYYDALGPPDQTIDAGLPAPAGHRSNQVHVFSADGIYLTEHHSSRLIESVNFVFDPADCAFPIEEVFEGNLNIEGLQLRTNMSENDLDLSLFARDLPGEYSLKYDNCWVGISAKGHRDSQGKRRKPRYIAEVSVCF